jgi:peptide deformylase
LAILKIARMGHPVLRRKADTVEDPTSPEVRLLVRDMLETMADAKGLGLAAPQVHVAKRLVIFHLPPSENVQDNSEEMPVRVLVNPTVEALDDEREDGWEGCLSLPGLRGLVPRFQRVRYRGIRPNGEIVDTVAEGLHARVVQHECDHLDGILYPMRMNDLSTLSFESEMRHAANE